MSPERTAPVSSSAQTARCAQLIPQTVAAGPVRVISVVLVAVCLALGCAGGEDRDDKSATAGSPSTDDESPDTAESDAGGHKPPTEAAADSGANSKPKPASGTDGSVKSDAGDGTPGAARSDAGSATTQDASTVVGDAGASDAAGEPAGDDACGADAQPVTGMTRKTGSGGTNLQTSGNVEILSARMNLKVPSKPTPTRGTLFLWPGLQPLKSDSTIGYGVLQPVLTWGSSCAPGTLTGYDTWWISAQYVGSPPGSLTNIKCEGGDVMKVEVGDELDIEMRLEGTSWNQIVTNKSNGKSVSFKKDMKGQKQQWFINSIELTGSTKPVDDVIFTSMVVKFSESQPKSCLPNVTGTTDYFTPPRVSSDGKTCCISKLVLRASGIKPSSPDTP